MKNNGESNLDVSPFGPIEVTEPLDTTHKPYSMLDENQGNSQPQSLIEKVMFSFGLVLDNWLLQVDQR